MNDAYAEKHYMPADGGGHFFVGDGVHLSHTAIIQERSVIGHRTFVGHHVVMRPETEIGSDCKIGHGSVFEGECQIGDRVLIHAQCHVTAGAVIEDDVFIAPMFVGANDARMSHGRRHVIPFERNAYVIRKGARIAIGVKVLPGVEIGRNAVIGAGAVVTQSIPAESIAVGVPARVVGKVDPSELL